MCGIVAAVAQRNVVPILVAGLKELEYRGYDSAGVAVVNGDLQRVRSVGRVAQLENRIRETQVHGTLGIAHTRWATHGVPAEQNAHPHVSNGQIAVVHNGIIENHEALRLRLEHLGYEFTSDTDTEVIVHLIEHHFRNIGDLLGATQMAVAELKGSYAIAAISSVDPQRLVCARRGSPLLIGLGIEENFVASDSAALLAVTRRMINLEDGDVADIGLQSCMIYDETNAVVVREERESRLKRGVTELGRFDHFMQKEIHEQPEVLADTLESLLYADRLQPEIFGDPKGDLLGMVRRAQVLACGTSYHAGMIFHYWLEELAGLQCSAEIASEYRYRTSVPDPASLVIAISQSGETADTLAAVAHATSLGQPMSLGICNVAESALLRLTSLNCLTRAGPEIGVASTKAFTTQLVVLLVLALVLAKLRGRLSTEQERQQIAMLRRLPGLASETLRLEASIKRWAEQIAGKSNALFLGRGVHFPVAMEGALKLKEISYIHAEAYAAGELKHGPLALVDENMPVIAIAPSDALIEKLKSNLQEVKARGGRLYVLTDRAAGIEESDNIQVIRMAQSARLLSPLLYTLPLQLLAYHTALQKGTDVDKPRNLAKSVTVE